jgi:hypothetical protein
MAWFLPCHYGRVAQLVRALPLQGRSRRFESYLAHFRAFMQKWEYLELKITHGEVEVVDGDFLPPANPSQSDPYEYVKRMVADGWQLVTRSGSLGSDFSVVLKRPVEE